MDFPVGFNKTVAPTTAMVSFPNLTPQPRRVLVTGGAGFIGSHLCERLLEIGCDLLCVDNFFTGTRRNIEHLLDHPRFEFLRHDITFPLYVEVDEIYNLACPASPVHYQWDPVQTTKTSVLGAINMLGLAKRLRGRILQASTSEVYGDPEVHPQQESYWGHVNPIGPRSCYDEGKRCAETLFFDYGRQHNLKIKVLRIFNTYGPRMQPNDGRVVSNFIVQALNNKHITIYGDGLQTRSFCFVDDLVSGMIGLMNTPDKITGPINCGNPNEFTIRDLAEKVIAMTGSRSRIVHRALPQDDPKQRRPDISQAQELLDWRPTVMLTEGLQRTISYFEQLLRLPVRRDSPKPTNNRKRACPVEIGAKADTRLELGAAEAQDNQEATRLIARASALLGQGNIGAARMVLEHVAEKGSAQASFMLAETYDRVILSGWGTYGTRGEATKARELYAKARAGGIQEAKDRLDKLGQ